jgi:hypothetical protein
MAVVVLALPPASLVPNRRKVVVAGVGGTVTFDITRPEVELDGLGDSWEETARVSSSRPPILERVGPRLRTFTLSALFTKERAANPSGEPASVDAELITLAELASPINANRTVTVAYDALLDRLTRSGGWVITDLRARSIRRRPSDNAITRAELDITFTEASRPPTPAQAGTTSSASSVAPVGPPPAPAATQAPPKPAQRRHTLRSGETLYELAQRFYGNGAYWQRIATANNIRDPRRLTVGTVLVIP